jgi:hypothetical protein
MPLENDQRSRLLLILGVVNTSRDFENVIIISP